MIMTPLAQADSTTKMEFQGVNGANNGCITSPVHWVMNYGHLAQNVVLSR